MNVKCAGVHEFLGALVLFHFNLTLNFDLEIFAQ